MRLRGVRRVGSGEVVDITITGGVVDLSPASAWSGRWVMPGLWDAHVHPTDWARTSHRVDLSDAASAKEALAVVAAAGRERAGELVGMGLWHSRWPEPLGSPGGPTRAHLDAVTGDVPAVLISADLHSAWFNSAAARTYGAPLTGSGLLTEEDWFARMPEVGKVDEATSDAWVREAGARAAARGVVGIVDFDAHDTLAAWERRIAAGFAEHRVRAAVWPEYLPGAIASGLRTGDILDEGAGGGLLEMGPLKVIFDGSLNTRTAWCHAPYPGGSTGAPNLPEADLRDLMSQAWAAGIHSAIHAIGDRANAAVLDAFEATGARGSIEHAQLLDDADVARFAPLGVRASVQPAHLLDDRDVAEDLWSGRTHRAYRFADLHRAGVDLHLGSDAPVAPLDPWLAISAAVTRTGDERPAWHGEQILQRHVALAASVDGRSLRPGAAADLVVLGADPLAVPAEELGELPVLQTICAGRTTFAA